MTVNYSTWKARPKLISLGRHAALLVYFVLIRIRSLSRFPFSLLFSTSLICSSIIEFNFRKHHFSSASFVSKHFCSRAFAYSSKVGKRTMAAEMGQMPEAAIQEYLTTKDETVSRRANDRERHGPVLGAEANEVYAATSKVSLHA